MNILRNIINWIAGNRSEPLPPTTAIISDGTTAAELEGTTESKQETVREIAPISIATQAEVNVENAISTSKDRGTGRGRGNLPRLTVGFDFGTHSSKVIYRKHGETASRLLCFDIPSTDYPSFVSPSLVRLDDNRLWFGSAANNRVDGLLYRFLKVRLLGPSREVLLEVYPPGPTPHQLVVAYLAWAFQAIHKQLISRHGEHRLRLNLAAPMLHFQDDKVREVYLHVVQAAWHLACGEAAKEMCQGIEWNTIQPIIKARLEEPLISESDRHFEVLPETIAPIVSMKRNPRVSPGFYLMVDMGGGTTEVSINNVGKADHENHIHCYADDLIQLGGLDFDEISTLKSTKKQVGLLKKLKDTARQVWYMGYMKEKDGHRSLKERWKILKVLLVGGGTKSNCVIREIEQHPPHKSVFLVDPIVYSVDRYKPVDIEIGDKKPSDVDLSLLSVAHGLAFDAQLWPDLLKPKEVEPIQKTERQDAPDPFWYVGGK